MTYQNDPGAMASGYPPQQHQPAPRPKPRTKWGLTIGLAVAALVIGCGGGYAIGHSGGTDLAGTASQPGAPTTTQPAAVANGIKGDGTYLVPSEVKPGTYRATVPADSLGCYWARLKNTSGDVAAIIANDNGSTGQTMTVTVASTDKAFQTTGCGGWAKV